MIPLKILPERVFGKRLTTAQDLKAATGPIVERTKATASFAMSSSELSLPSFSTTSPTGSCPFRLSATPKTAVSATWGWVDRTSSMAPVDNLCPATFMISSVLAITKT